MTAHTNEPLIDLHITGPAEKMGEALAVLHGFGYVEKSERVSSWRDAFPSEVQKNEEGIALKVTRKRKGLSQTDLPATTGISQPHISQMERGRRPIGKKTARQLEEALQVDYRVFL